MKNYIVRIKAIVVKDIEVEAVNEEEAKEIAHSIFTVAPDDDTNEKYEQDTVSVKLVKN